MDNSALFTDLRVFYNAVRYGSFVATANELGTSPAYIGKRIALLENALKVKLFHRTTRRVVVTDDGEKVYQWARKILEDVDRMTEDINSGSNEPSGSLRITTSFRLGTNHVAPAISELARRYPKLDVWLEVLDRRVDLVNEGIDLDIRIGQVQEPNLIAHRIAPSNRVLCAAPSYIERRGMPKTLADLAQHSCLVLRERDQAFGVWRLNGPNGVETVKVTGALSSNNAGVVRHWVHAGHGILLIASWDVADSLASGRLVQLLPAYQQEADVWAVSTTRLARSAKLRVCVQFLQEQLTHGQFALGKTTESQRDFR